MIDFTFEDLAQVQLPIDEGAVFGAAMLLFRAELNNYVANDLQRTVDACAWFHQYMLEHNVWWDDLDYLKEELAKF